MITYRMTETATIKRQIFASGKRTGFQTHLSNVPCTMTLPARPADVAALELNVDRATATAMYEIFLDGDRDVQPSDQVETGGKVYRVHAAWPWAHRVTVTRVLMSKDGDLS